MQEVNINRSKENAKNSMPEIGTLMRAIIPAGSVMKLFTFVEAVPEKDVVFTVKIPFFLKSSSYAVNFVNTVKQSGGTIEVLEE